MPKYRHELKFLCSQHTLKLIEEKVRQICTPDAHANDSGIYNIRSVYFDSFDDKCLDENLDGVDNRYKYRIRIYNHSDSLIKLERKATLRGLKTKESCVITRDQCEGILRNKWVDCDPMAQNLLERFQAEKCYELYEPKVIVEYTRTPYVHSAGNVRITFDRNILSSWDMRFFEKDIPKVPVLPEGIHLLEVKYDEYLPGAIREVISGGCELKRV